MKKVKVLILLFGMFAVLYSCTKTEMNIAIDQLTGAIKKIKKNQILSSTGAPLKVNNLKDCFIQLLFYTNILNIF